MRSHYITLKESVELDYARDMFGIEQSVTKVIRKLIDQSERCHVQEDEKLKSLLEETLNQMITIFK
jgi:hypothetical protein